MRRVILVDRLNNEVSLYRSGNRFPLQAMKDQKVQVRHTTAWTIGEQQRLHGHPCGFLCTRTAAAPHCAHVNIRQPALKERARLFCHTRVFIRSCGADATAASQAASSSLCTAAARTRL